MTDPPVDVTPEDVARVALSTAYFCVAATRNDINRASVVSDYARAARDLMQVWLMARRTFIGDDPT